MTVSNVSSASTAETNARSAEIQAFAERLKASMPVPVSVAVVLGSGIKALEDLHGGGSCPYAELPGFPETTVAGHAGVMSWGQLGEDGPGVMVARGRFHLYEGHGLSEALMIVEFLHALGVPNVVLTNAAGGLRPDWTPGDLMLIEDHVNMQNLLGGYQAGFGGGLQVVEPYDAAWRKRFKQHCLSASYPLRTGTYLGLMGPTYETLAETRLLQFAGADAVGMSTVPEVARAASYGMKVLAISCITNIASTAKGAAETSHQEVVDVAKASSELMENMLHAAVLTAAR